MLEDVEDPLHKKLGADVILRNIVIAFILSVYALIFAITIFDL